MSIEQISELPDVSEGLENAIKKSANECNNLNDLINGIKSKRYTQTRIQRILIYALLGIDKKTMENSRKVNPYIRILGFTQKGKQLLSEISRKNPKLNIITSVKKYVDQNKNKQLAEMLKTDIFATDIYTLGYEYESKANLDFTQNMIITN
jgi:predicted nucleotidyltransferase